MLSVSSSSRPSSDDAMENQSGNQLKLLLMAMTKQEVEAYRAEVWLPFWVACVDLTIP
jgi:hypothetical protein